MQLPDGASKERTDAVMQKIAKIAGAVPGVDHVVTVSGISILDNRASLANAGVAFVVLKDWDVRLKAKGQDARSITQRLNGGLQGVPEAFTFALPPPPIQGIGNVGGFTMQVELKNGNFDYALLQSLTNAVVANANAQSSLSRVATTFRAGAPQFFVKVDRIKAERIGVTVGQVFSALSGYVGAGYVGQFDKFGHVFQIYTQAEPNYRANADDIRNLKVKAGDGTMVAIGTVAEISEVQGPPLISLYNLYPVVHRRRQRGAGLQFGPVARHHGPDRQGRPCRRDRLRLDRHVLPGEAGRQSDLLCLRLRAAARLSRPRRASTRAGFCRLP